MNKPIRDIAIYLKQLERKEIEQARNIPIYNPYRDDIKDIISRLQDHLEYLKITSILGNTNLISSLRRLSLCYNIRNGYRLTYGECAYCYLGRYLYRKDIDNGTFTKPYFCLYTDIKRQIELTELAIKYYTKLALGLKCKYIPPKFKGGDRICQGR